MYANILNTVTASGAVAVGAFNITILAAPGANLAYRIVGGSIGIDRTVAGRVQAGLAGVHSTVDLTILGGLDFRIPEPGIQLAVNTGLIVNCAGTVAGGNVSCVLYYYLDSRI